jgi:hypothetical protein
VVTILPGKQFLDWLASNEITPEELSDEIDPEKMQMTLDHLSRVAPNWNEQLDREDGALRIYVDLE